MEQQIQTIRLNSCALCAFRACDLGACLCADSPNYRLYVSRLDTCGQWKARKDHGENG